MRNVMKAATLESKFPLLAVENGCIVSKEADVTVAFHLLHYTMYPKTGRESREASTRRSTRLGTRR